MQKKEEIMRKKYLLLPLVTLFSLTSCNNAGDSSSSSSNLLPPGGQEILEVEERNLTLARAMKGFSDNVSSSDSFWFDVDLNELSFKLDSPKLQVESKFGDFKAQCAALNLFTGDKASAKAAIKTKDGYITNRVKSDLEGEEKIDYSKNINFSNMNFYLDNGGLYLDFGDNDVAEVVSSFANILYQFIGAYIGDSNINEIIKSIAEDKANFTQLINIFFGDGFNNKIKLEGLIDDSNFPLANLGQVESEEEALETVEDYEKKFEEESGLPWEAVFTAFDYGDGTGFQFAFPFAYLNKSLNLEESGWKYNDYSAVTVAAVLDKENKPLALNTYIDFGVDFLDEEVTNACGGTLTAHIVAAVTVNFEYEDNGVTFPENYNDYKAPLFADYLSFKK